MYKQGEILYDREQNERVVVVQLLSDPCDDVVCKEGQYGEQTVWDFNKRYDYVSRDDPVVVAKYYSSLQEILYAQGNFKSIDDGLTRGGRADLASKSSVKQYYFPITRLVQTQE